MTVDALYEGQRIDNFLFTRLKGVPKSRIYRILRKGEVRVNKKRIKPDYRIQPLDEIRIPPITVSEKPVIASPSLNAQKFLTSHVIYEDNDLLVVNKPAGMAAHGGSGIQFGVIETLRHARPQHKFLELVHRLDRDTSGCMLIAKKPSILKQLHEQLRNGDVEKIYTTLVRGHWSKSIRTVDAPLKKNQLQSGERIVAVSKEGKSALTEFRVIQRFDKATLLEAKPKTGRTHQIRVHALYASHPIAADEKYGDKEFNKMVKNYGCKRLFLHASRLVFTLADDKKIDVEAQLPADLQAVLANMDVTN